MPEEPTSEHVGVIVKIRPDKWFGHVRAEESDQIYRFDTRVIKGNTPHQKARVRFTLRGKEVIKVEPL